MKQKKDYIICYDICDKKRLAKLAKILEKQAIRIQYSVFLFSWALESHLALLIEDITAVIDREEDDVRIYTVLDSGTALGQALKLDEPYIFAEGGLF